MKVLKKVLFWYLYLNSGFALALELKLFCSKIIADTDLP